MTEAALVDGGAVVEPAGARNAAFSVRWADSPGLFVKQLVDPRPWSVGELRLYPRVQARAEPALRVMPRLHFMDPERKLFVLERVPSASSLWRLLEENDAASIGRFTQLGEALAGLHGVFASWDRAKGTESRPWTDVRPWGFQVHDLNVGILTDLSGANLALVRIFAESIPRATIEAARAAWRPSTVVHHDLKVENVLVPPDAHPARIVDWEFAGWGDPAWDVATLLQSLLLPWLHHSASEEGARARATLAATRVRCAAFWRGYAASLGDVERRALRDRTALLSAVRLLQTAFEMGHAQPRLGKLAVIAAQVAANVGERPDEAATELYGLG